MKHKYKAKVKEKHPGAKCDKDGKLFKVVLCKSNEFGYMGHTKEQAWQRAAVMMDDLK